MSYQLDSITAFVAAAAEPGILAWMDHETVPATAHRTRTGALLSVPLEIKAEPAGDIFDQDVSRFVDDIVVELRAR